MSSKRSERNERIINAVLLGGLLFAGSIAARRATTRAWGLVDDAGPPDPDDPDTALRHAVLWSLASGMAVGLTRLALRRQFARARTSPGRRLQKAVS